MTPSKVVRLVADLSPDVARALQAMADRHNVSISEAVRAVICNQAYLQRQRRAGARVFVQERGGAIVEPVFKT